MRDMRRLLPLLLVITMPAAAVDRIELRIGRIDAPGWQLRDLAADWHRDGRLRLRATAQQPDLPAPLHAEFDCARLQTHAGLRCESLQLRAALDDARVEAAGALHVEAADRWQLRLRRAQLRLQHDSPDGRLAAENLRLELSGDLRQGAADMRVQLQARTASGQAYVEPWFVDFDAQPLAFDVRARLTAGDALDVEHLRVQQRGLGSVTASGRLSVSAWREQHRLQIDAEFEDAAAAAPYAQAALATTPLRELRLAGAAQLTATVENARLLRADAKLRELSLAAPALAVELDGVNGELAWDDAPSARASHLAWRGGRIGRIPVGATRLAFETAGRRVALRAPARVPLLDGSLAIERLALSGIGGADLQADFAARLQPINLPGLCRALGWPEFAGTLSGEIPGLQLRDQRLLLEGALTASAFDGEIRISDLRVIEPLGVLPRLHADIRLRRLDLAAVTGAFDFGRITGRLDGDIDGLRLIGWEPVAMDAHLYSTPGDRSRKRISQRAIDNISAVGGGPTGLLSRGVMRFFDDFAYRRIGWRCVLDNGVCRMQGIRPSDEGDGYVLVQGWGLPRIDVVGYSRRVSWPVFMSQLRSIGKTGPARVDGP